MEQSGELNSSADAEIKKLNSQMSQLRQENLALKVLRLRLTLIVFIRWGSNYNFTGFSSGVKEGFLFHLLVNSRYKLLKLLLKGLKNEFSL